MSLKIYVMDEFFNDHKKSTIDVTTDFTLLILAFYNISFAMYLSVQLIHLLKDFHENEFNAYELHSVMHVNSKMNICNTLSLFLWKANENGNFEYDRYMH